MTNQHQRCHRLLPACHLLPPSQSGLSQHRPLLRVRHQFLGDLAALLSGLRVVLMLDYAAGITPQQLGEVLQPLQHTLPGWTGASSLVAYWSADGNNT